MTPDTNANGQGNIYEYEDCVVAFLDILGFKSKVLESENKKEILDNIIEFLKIANVISSSGNKKVTTNSGEQRIIDMRNRFFSDLLVCFLRPNPQNIAQLFFVIRYLQDQLWQQDICLRGAVVLGRMYWPENDDKITVGQGLIDAYYLESTIAIYPRIVVSDALYKFIKKEKIKAKPFGKNGALAKLIREDADGIRFLDLLNPEITRTEGECLDTNMGGDLFTIWNNPKAPSRHSDILNFVENICKKAKKKRKDEKIKQKYAWLDNYRKKILCELCEIRLRRSG